MPGTRKLGRPTAHRIAMLRGMVTLLLENGQIETTLARAKEVRSMAEKMITLGKKNTLASRRAALAYITKESVVTKLFTEIAPSYANRNGGYTRILKLGTRRGDAAEMAIVALVKEEKAEAAALFVRWLTEPERNLDFVAQTGYMPVRNGAFDSIENYDKFPEPAESYQQLYAALKTMREDYTPVSEPRFEGYYSKVSALYDGLRQLQKELPARAAAGENVDALAEETWALLCSIQ